MTSTKYAPIAPLLRTDAYKLGHRDQYQLAGDVTRVYSNFTNRKSRIGDIHGVVHFGLQAFIQKYLVDEFEVFFAERASTVGRLYEERLEQILGPNDIGSQHIRDLNDLGYLPLRFNAVPEGTIVPIRVPSFTIENTLPEFYWLTNYIETCLSAGVWQASTAATIAHQFRGVLEDAAARTGGAPEAVDFQCHDFSYRGMSSNETAAITGAAHLTSFKGTDSLVSLDWIDRYYGGDYQAMSVPATEHSVMCTGIEKVGEQALFEGLLDLYPSGIVSVVSDTFDLWKVLKVYLPALRDKIMARDGKLVIRPDSGDPEKILCGDHDAPSGSAEWNGVIRLLDGKFGNTLNSEGFRVLDPHVGAIYGDSITIERARSITRRLEQMGYASTNVVFGVGSYTYQYNTRDTFGSALKATWAEVDGEGVNLLKDPVTDDGTKKSATGRLAVYPNAATGELLLAEKADEYEEEYLSVLQPVWEDGEFIKFQDFADVRATLAQSAANA